MNDAERRDEEEAVPIMFLLAFWLFPVLLVASLVGWILGFDVRWLLVGAGIAVVVALGTAFVQGFKEEFQDTERDRMRRPNNPCPTVISQVRDTERDRPRRPNRVYPWESEDWQPEDFYGKN